MSTRVERRPVPASIHSGWVHAQSTSLVRDKANLGERDDFQKDSDDRHLFDLAGKQCGFGPAGVGTAWQ
jgi:hypothetical protein